MSLDSVVRPPLKADSLWGGIAIAVAAQALAIGPWSVATYLFIRYGAPDTLFFATLCSLFLGCVSFAGCVGGGSRVMRRNRSLGLGLVFGWVGGLVALLVWPFLAALL